MGICLKTDRFGRIQPGKVKNMKIKTLKDIKYKKGSVAFCTCDFNISLKNGEISNDTRISQTLPTIKLLKEKGMKVVLASHLGRPKGYDKKYSLKVVADRLSELSSYSVELIDKYWEPEALKRIKGSDKDIVLLENIRFVKEEKENNPDFARHLSKMADFFVNDAFGASHRIHASIVGISQHLNSYAGLLLEKEVEMINKAIFRHKRPFLMIIGGAKTPEKISVIEKTLDKADTVMLGGAIANTFLAAWGYGTGDSLVDYEMIEMAKVVFWNAAKKHSALILPSDVVISGKQTKLKSLSVDYNKVPNNYTIYDIGPKTLSLYKKYIHKAKTIIWNGPMGLYENDLYKKGTDDILKYVSTSDSYSIIGGGDTISSLKNEKYLKGIDHISTGGSAMLEYIQKESLPGIDVLKK
jgi:phosphoglycerate kinase